MDPRVLCQDGKIRRGVKRPVNVQAPGAGNQWQAQVPGGVQWNVLGGQALFTTSAAVANRFTGLTITHLGVTVYVNAFNNNVAASTNRQVIYQQGSSLNVAAAPLNLLPVPYQSPWLSPGDTIQSLTAGFDAGDTYTQVQLIVEEVYFTNSQLTQEALEREQDYMDWLAAHHPAGATQAG